MSEASDVLPVQRFSPAPGIWIDRTEKSVAVTGAMELYGDEANAARALSIEHSINATWTQTFPDGYAITCNITVRYRGPGSSAGNATQIEAKQTSGPSHVRDVPGLDRCMTLNASEPDAFTWTPTHEFGHILGLKDRYSESIMSKIVGSFGGTRSNTVHPGYQGNLMAVDQGKLESKNVADLATENEPSPWWLNDDDQVRAWVNAHSTGDIGRLSTASKLKAIKTLMGGWISDDDVDAMGKICSSVTTKAEADAIRNGVDLLDFTSLGQRTRMRVFFAKMP
jgi:hypothetical protein